MLDNRKCEVSSAAELDAEIRDILSLEMVYPDRADEISGTLHIHYSDESVKDAKLIRSLEDRGIAIEWHPK